MTHDDDDNHEGDDNESFFFSHLWISMLVIYIGRMERQLSIGVMEHIAKPLKGDKKFLKL